MKSISLTRGYVTVVSDEDYELLSKFKWHTVLKGRRNDVPYATSTQFGYMHRFILQATPDIEIDHIDRNPLNNQRENLRVASHSINGQNKETVNTRAGYKGVWPNHKRWSAMIKKDGKRVYIGTFDTKELAAEAYNETAKHLFGKNAYLNQVA